MTLHLDKLSTVGKFIAQEEEWWLLRVEGGQNGELLLNGYAFPFRKIGKFWTWWEVMVAKQWQCT